MIDENQHTMHNCIFFSLFFFFFFSTSFDLSNETDMWSKVDMYRWYYHKQMTFSDVIKEKKKWNKSIRKE